MKNTTLDNPEIIVKDRRIVELDNIVTEVKQSEEWEAVKMNILEIGMAKGREEGLEKGREEGREEGIQEGVLQGTQEGIFLTLAGLVKDGLLSVEEASKRVQVTVEEFEKRMQEEDNV